MAPRIHLAGKLVNGDAGRVHITRYPGEITLEAAQRSQEDYLEHIQRFGGEPTPLVIIPEKPLPLPDMEVRKYWREVPDEPGFECIALLLTGVMGLMAATVTHFSEQLVGVLGVNIRSFKTSDDVGLWLSSRFDCEVDEFDIADAIDEVLAARPE